ncbi:MAG TPA: methyltransferase domain-containing protein [Rhizomicrobium sp.]|nr:methyltransferase domain-containing protein [Rhizomicrobium sp.]
MSASRPPLFDHHMASLAQARAAAIAGDRFLIRAATENIAERLAAVTRHFARGLLIGERVPTEIGPFADTWTTALFDRNEMLGLDRQNFDVGVSVFSLQTINDLPGALIQVRRALKPDGLFLAALFGGGTLKELRDSFAHGESETLGGISPRISPFADVRDLGSLLQRARFALPVADGERLTVRYGDFSALVRDLRAHGQTNALSERSRKPLRRATLAAMLEHYRDRHSDDGKLLATFEILYLTGWAPHESQQQPLRPGSAKVRLADALRDAAQPLKNCP